MTKKTEEQLCNICEKQPVVYNDLCTDCLAKALSGAQKRQVTGEEARKLLLAEQMSRVQAARKETKAIHAKHQVALDVYMIVRPTGTIVQAQFVPQEGWAGDPASLGIRTADVGMQ